MNFLEHAVHPSLAAHLECVWTLSSTDEPGTALPDEAGLVTPDGCVELVFARRGTTIGLPGTPNRGAAFVLGIATRPLRVSYGDRASLVGVRLRPSGAVRLLGPDLASMTDSAAPARDALSPTTARLATTLESADDHQAAALAMHEIGNLLNRQARRAYRADDRVGAAMNTILASRGRLSISALSRHLNLSTRHLDRCFDRSLGISPKTYCRIARFRAAWRLGLESAAHSAWAAIALRCGYADQAHLCRDFREFSGTSPAAALAAR